MTIIETRQAWMGSAGAPAPAKARNRRRHPRALGPVRPGGTPLTYRGTGVALSRAAHKRRPVGAVATAALAGLAALITLWLGTIAQSGGIAGTTAGVPDRVAVVRVEAGESLAHVASRVAPDAPVGQVVARIRELNDLPSAALEAGQTLIAPIGASAGDGR
jgi:LysM domain